MKAVLFALALLGTVAACAGSAGVPAPQNGSAATPSASGSQFAVAVTVSAAPSMPLPAGGGYSGTFAVSGTIQRYAQITETLQNALPPSLPSLSSKLRTVATRGKLDVASGGIFVYFGINGTARLPGLGTYTPPATFPPSSPTDPPPAAVAVTLNIPAAAQAPGTSYYLAFYDPLRPTLGWQLGFEGPSQSGSTLTFTGNAATFVAYQQYWFALYVATGAAPTAAPSIPPIATPSPAPVTLTNLQNQMGLTTTCSGTPCATGQLPSAQPTATYSIGTGVSSPSLSGSSTRLTVVSDTNHEDVLFFTPPQPFLSPLATTFTWDFSFAIDQPLVDTSGRPVGPIEALEFDSNIGLPGFGYNFSSQCLIQTGNVWVWQIWGYDGNGSEQNWVNSGITCDPSAFTPYPAWHHIVWTYSINPDLLKKQYLSLSFDGTTYVPTQNAVGAAEARSGQKASVEVQFQIDTRPVSATNTTPIFNEWVDNANFTYH